MNKKLGRFYNFIFDLQTQNEYKKNLRSQTISDKVDSQDGNSHQHRLRSQSNY